jgi:hypothetical protein
MVNERSSRHAPICATMVRTGEGGTMRERGRISGRRAAALGGALWLLGSACAGEHSGLPGLLARTALLPRGAGTCGTAYLGAVEDTFRLDADTATPGTAPQVVFEMFIPGSSPANQILLTRRVVITLPAEFGFQGFGAVNAPAGSWDFDFTHPGNGVFDPIGSPSDYRIPHRSTGSNNAYADTLLNGAFDAGIDSTASHSVGAGGAHVFSVSMPSGGTNNNGLGGNCSYFDTDVRFTLPPGIVTLPQAPGSYDVTVVATSVDPDTGDTDDGQGTPPTVYQRTVTIDVPEPGAGATAGAALLALALRRLSRRGR